VWRNYLAERKFRLGIAATAGVEYIASRLPIAFALEYIPSYSRANSEGSLELQNWTAAVRYTFGKD
jgi:hypothetical protein